MNDCTKVKCPFNALTFKDCKMTASECEYHTKQMTNGDVLKRVLYGKAIITEFIHDVNISVNNNVIGQFDREWWNAPYKRGDTE